MSLTMPCAWAAVRLALLCVSLCCLICVEPYSPLSGDERPSDCNIEVELQGWYSCKETVKGRHRKPAIALHSRVSLQHRQEHEYNHGCTKLCCLQGTSRRRQFIRNIYAFETALPEKLLQRGIGPLGDTTRLLKLFHKLLTGMLCTLTAVMISCTGWLQQI